MKNKHLVLLFLIVLTLGLLRYLPVRYRPVFHNDLIRVDTVAMTQCIVVVPGQSEISIERSETGWVADQNGRVAPLTGADMAPLLEALAGIRALRRVKTGLPDSLGFTPGQQLKVQIFNGKRLMEYFELGHELRTNDQPATYLRLPMHKGVYLAEGHLRRLFTRTLDDFRPKSVLWVSPASVRSIGIWQAQADTLIVFEKNDSLRCWGAINFPYTLSDDSVQNWLGLLHRLNGSPFADNFDESQDKDSRLAAFYLKTADSSELALQFYLLKPPNIPEDLSGLRRQHWQHLPVYVVHSSQNPMNYFAAPDTNLVRFLCSGWWSAPPAEKQHN
ncbi:MAG: DUF4340 domain-containing protein [Thermoanaerobaculia bacterium]|nr:DUF4340 domain-containing protein [Thermoanaerobaculia bacterium]